jgi:DNA repair exonuclease SbcCD ATPase subunit
MSEEVKIAPVLSDSVLIEQAIAAAEAATGEQPAQAAAKAEPVPDTAPAAEPTKEEPAQEAKEAAEEEPKESVARGWAAIKQKDKELQRLRHQLKDEQATIEARVKEAEALKEQYAKSIEALKADPLAALKELGFTYDDLTHRVLNDSPSADERVRRMETETQRELRELKERYEQLEQSVSAGSQESVKAQHQQAIADYQRQTLNEVNDEAFPFLMAEVGGDKHAAAAEVLAVAQYIAQQQEKVLTPSEAAGMIEAELVRKYKALHERGIFGRLTNSDPSAASVKGQSNLPAGNKPKTITNSNTASRTDSDPVDLSRMTDREQIEWALKFVG